MKTFSQETRKKMSEAYNGQCDNCLQMANDCHHMLPNTKVNQQKFPLFLQSPMNLQPLCRYCHVGNLFRRINPEEAKVYEEYLKDLKESYNRSYIYGLEGMEDCK